MNSYPISNNEKERLQELYNYQILDSSVEREFDDLVQIAARTFNVPVAAITFVDASRQWIKAQKGLDICELDREVSVCNYTLLQDNIMEVEDLQQDDRFRHFPYIAQAPFYRYYAGVPLITSNGYKIGIFCIIDTKVRKLNEEEKQTLAALARQSMRQVELRLRNMQLENLNEKQRYISSMLSHDIKNPLSNIKMMLDMQEQGDEFFLKENAAQLNDMLAKQVNSTINMLNNIVRWGKLQLNGNENKIQCTNLRQLAGEIVDDIALDCSLKQNVVVNAIPANINAHVDGEGVRFALRNLLTNANKFTTHGCITISYEHKDGKAYIHVADTGVGMNIEQLTNLNRNKQISSSYGTHNEKGSGLGLGLLYDYLTEKDGQLLFQSEVGRGTKVSFTL